jgi:3-oxoadipate enol-lactonase
VGLPPLLAAEIGGRVLAWREAGTGTPLLLLHGIGGSSEIWAAQYKALADGFRVIGWDMPGYGGSSALSESAATLDSYVDALSALMDTLGITAGHILGQSVAAPIAARFARRHPDRTLSFVFCHGLSGLGHLPEAERAAATEKRLATFEKLGPERFARERGPGILAPDADPEVIGTAVAIMARVRPEGYRAAVAMLAGADIRADLPHVIAPALVLCGDSDPVAPPDACRTVAELLPECSLRVLKGVGHYSCLEDPAVFNVALGEFLQAVSARKV